MELALCSMVYHVSCKRVEGSTGHMSPSPISDSLLCFPHLSHIYARRVSSHSLLVCELLQLCYNFAVCVKVILYLICDDVFIVSHKFILLDCLIFMFQTIPCVNLMLLSILHVVQCKISHLIYAVFDKFLCSNLLCLFLACMENERMKSIV